MRIVFAGGGTVGHISPSIAIAEELKKRDAKCEILFIGREHGEENDAVTRAGFNLKTVKINGLERRITPNNLKNIAVAVRAIAKAKEMLSDFKPDLVFGTGGYVSYPILKAAQRLRIKTAIHESNASLGLASRAVLPRCDLLFTGFDTEEGLAAATRRIISGTPVRDEFLNADREASRKKLGISKGEILIASFGGSGGSRALNDAILELMKSYSMKKAQIRHIHASGRKYYKDIALDDPLIVNGRNGCIVKPYINDVATLLCAADIAITRCGAMTLAELAATGTPAILIPSPNVTNDHQRKNASHLANSGAAIVISEDELTPALLGEKVKSLAENRKLRHEMSKKISEASKKDARKIIADEIARLV